MRGLFNAGLAALFAATVAGCSAAPPEHPSLETTVRLTLFARDLEPLTRDAAAEELPSVSSDGRFVWFQSYGSSVANREIYRLCLPGGPESRVTHHDGFDGAPAASADGESAVFVSVREGIHGLWTARADGASGTRRILESRAGIDRPSFSPDGSAIAFGTSGGAARNEFWVCTCAPDGSRRVELARGAWPAYSPDGTRIAFVRDDGGQTATQVWIMSRDGTGLSRVTSLTGLPGASHPAWSPDGSLIAFDAPYRGSSDTDLWLVPVAGGEPARLTCSYGSETAPAWTPDGRLAFAAETLDAPGTGRNWNIWMLTPTAFTR